MPAIGQLGVDAISLKPGGSSVTLSPWLIQTLSMPWPSVGREVLDAVEQPRVAARAHLGVAELALRARLDLAAQLLRHRLHAVADAEHRHAELEHRLRRAQRRAPRRSLAWLPERMMPLRLRTRARTSSLTSYGWISQKTCASRTRRAISCVTCEPKSRMRILSCMSGGARAERRRCRARRAALKCSQARHERGDLHQRRRSRTARRCASRRAAGARRRRAAAR